jgi:hypothetical protein
MARSTKCSVAHAGSVEAHSSHCHPYAECARARKVCTKLQCMDMGCAARTMSLRVPPSNFRSEELCPEKNYLKAIAATDPASAHRARRRLVFRGPPPLQPEQKERGSRHGDGRLDKQKIHYHS